MTYQQTLAFLYTKLPMFTRIGAIALKKDLHNTIALCEALANPQHKFKSIHVAGTNGKGSTSHMLAAILQKAGYKTGLYTSPHLKDFRERIRINGKMIPKSTVIDFVKTHKTLIHEIEPSFFEVTVGMAFDYFANEKVDFAVIEVGLGGRLDSTNIITPELSVITNISLDHTNILGNTLAEIAKEKAGIIKRGVPVVIGEQQEETENVFIEKAKLENASIYFADKLLKLKDLKVQNSKLVVSVQMQGNSTYPKLKLDLTGTYQQKNILTVLESIQQLKNLGYEISDYAVYSGLATTKKITGLQGRWQRLSTNPLVICDTGHNIAGITEVLKNIFATAHQKLHFVIGMVKDKDISSVLTLLPKNASYYFCAPKLERALAANELAIEAATFGLKGSVFPSVKEALEKAKYNANKNDLVFIGGSTFVVAEII
ncbi:bifunctional folylpolyglutamate synthase/dihydrofolate synthase [Pedobacter insulae]|uniref:Dihydrofolate synthase/folylpolyglutamate synthase n=1 Tax=Pedobacter insulae TaxID=414048 RepID=A0A1I2UDV3_9SPHI|nr:folylpolyglutamate synthase/dihydrofolate synthase family protein [Pedobacter insulae]SFG73016.1 dihydrofolate synthase / folylpolyglutamate synthase [Pedobacter insulae]